jgi:hypothetical protein
VVCNATPCTLLCYTIDDAGKRSEQHIIPIGSRLTVPGTLSVDLEMDLDSMDTDCESDYRDVTLFLKPEGGADAGSQAASHWVVTVEGWEVRGHPSAGVDEPACWQVSNDGFEYDARDQATIECWHKSCMSRRQAITHVKRLMKEALVCAHSGFRFDAARVMKRLLAVLRHMSGYTPQDFRFLPFLSTADELMLAPLSAHELKEVAKILRGFGLQSPALKEAAGEAVGVANG